MAQIKRAFVAATIMPVALLVPVVAAAPSEGAAACVSEADSSPDAVNWRGEPSQALVVVGDKLQKFVDEHPSLAAGVSYRLNYSGVEIYTPNVPEVSRALPAFLSGGEMQVVI